MTKVTIISGFLGAGKTTLIQKLLKEAWQGEQVVLIENEFGEIGIDGGFLKEAGIEITEMNSGCICCSLSGDFKAALQKVVDQYHPGRIVIEPSGVGKLSDVQRAVLAVGEELQLVSSCTVVDVNKCAMYQKNFGEFFNDQIEYADALILSRTQGKAPEEVEACMTLLRSLNPEASLVSTPWDQLDGKVIMEAMEHKGGLRHALMEEEEICEGCGHHHDHGHGHDHDHHHDHEGCGHHHHHHADEVFSSWGAETAQIYTEAELQKIVKALASDPALGQVLRAKGMLQVPDGWYYFDVTPGEYDVRKGAPDYSGRYCVIGAKLDEQALKQLFEKAGAEPAGSDWTIEVE